MASNFDESIPRYVGTLVGESTSREFRLAVAHETIREQDIIAVDAELRQPDQGAQLNQIRVWAKVQRIERLNPLFPTEAGHELAAFLIIMVLYGSLRLLIYWNEGMTGGMPPATGSGGHPLSPASTMIAIPVDALKPEGH